MKLLSSMEKLTMRRRVVMTPLGMTSMRRNPFKSLSLMDSQRHSLMDSKIFNFVHLKRHSLVDLKIKILNLINLKRPSLVDLKILNLMNLFMRETLVLMDPCGRETMTLRPMDPRGRETKTLIPMDPRPGETISCVRMDPPWG